MWKHIYLAKCKYNVHTQSDNNVVDQITHIVQKEESWRTKSDSLFEHDQKQKAGNVGRAT